MDKVHHREGRVQSARDIVQSIDIKDLVTEEAIVKYVEYLKSGGDVIDLWNAIIVATNDKKETAATGALIGIIDKLVK